MMTQNATTLTVHFELQLTGQTEHQLGGIMTMAEYFVTVVTQGQNRGHGVFLGNRRRVTSAVMPSDVRAFPLAPVPGRSDQQAGGVAASLNRGGSPQRMTLSRSFSAAWLSAWITRSLSKFWMPLVSRYMEKPGSSCST